MKRFVLTILMVVMAFSLQNVQARNAPAGAGAAYRRLITTPTRVLATEPFWTFSIIQKVDMNLIISGK
jgi:hypothetical protein